MLQAGAIFCRQTELPRDRQRTLALRKPERIGDITVTALPVDHSIFGAVAFLIEAAGRRVLYSGDLRLHGREPGLTRDLIKAATAAPLDLLLIEGTHLSRRLDAIATTEWELEEEISKLVAAAQSLVLAFLSPQHVQRVLGFYHAARRAGRTFVVDSYAAFILHLLRYEPGVPDPANSPGLRVYVVESQAHIPQVETRLTESRITLNEVLAKPERHVLLCRPNMLKRDLGGTAPAKTLGLYSMWHGYLKDDDWQRTQRIIADVDGDFIECHTSGHATVPDIVQLIRELRPRRVIPIHTERPDVLKELVPGVEIAEDGVAILL
jgi:ribonuclease J